MIIQDSCLRYAPAELGIDCVITDPPFSAHVHESVLSTRTGGAEPRKRDLGFAHLGDDLRNYIAACAAAAKRWSVIFCDHEGAHKWREAMAVAKVEYIRYMPWVRWSQPQISGDRPPTGSEAVLHFHAEDEPDADSIVHFHAAKRGKPVKKHWNGSGGLTHYDARCLRGVGKHPTEKPLDLMLTIVSAFSDPGDAVYDPCCGAGTTILAARLLDRIGVGIELDERWAKFAAARETAPLCKRDRDRAAEWVEKTVAEAQTVPRPEAEDALGWPTYRRALARIADAERVRKVLEP